MIPFMAVRTNPQARLTGIIGALNPLLWYRFDEAATPLINYGSAAGMNATDTNIGAFQTATGIPAAPYSYTYNGTTSIASTGTGSISTPDFTIACLINAATAGEGSQGYFVEILTSASGGCARLFFNSALTSILLGVTDSVLGEKLTASSGAGVTANTWTWVFAVYPGSTTKLPLLYRTVSGVVTEYNYGAHNALTNAVTTAAKVNIGNNAATSRTFDGKYARFMLFPAALTLAQMQQIASVSGV